MTIRDLLPLLQTAILGRFSRIAVSAAAALVAILVCTGAVQATRNRGAEAFVVDFLASVRCGSDCYRRFVAPGFEAHVEELRRGMAAEHRPPGCRSLLLTFSRSYECVVQLGNGSLVYLDVGEERGAKLVTAVHVAAGDPAR